MNHKVLLADDSLTIQKVIRITLANQPYDIVDCATEEELFKKLPDSHPKIVFLDFNLSDKYTGYELSKKIKEISPSTQVLLLLGTFDSVEDELMEKNGIAEKIVKPFDSNKFIAICKRLADMGESFSVDYPEEKTLPEEDPFAASEEDNWTVTRAAEVETPSAISVEAEVTSEEFNALESQMADWGISVPEVIGAPSKPLMNDIPPVIDEEEGITSTDQLFVKEEIKLEIKETKKDETVLPSSEDLEWPTIDDMIEKPAASQSSEGPKSKLISIESFTMEDDQAVDDQWAMQKLYGNETETDVKSIEDQIREEIESDLWSADEIESKPKLKVVKEETALEEKHEFKPTLNDFDESLFAPIDELEATPTYHAKETAPSINKDALINELRPMIEESVKKAVKEYLDQYLKQSVEKVTWEVIPDLAENLIRQELNKISQQILGE